MLEVGVFNNGANGLPIRVTDDGVTQVDASLSEVRCFAEDILPKLQSECGGGIDRPQSAVNPGA